MGHQDSNSGGTGKRPTRRQIGMLVVLVALFVSGVVAAGATGTVLDAITGTDTSASQAEYSNTESTVADTSSTSTTEATTTDAAPTSPVSSEYPTSTTTTTAAPSGPPV